MDNGSSDTYYVRVTLITEAGDLPDKDEVESLIASQMSGELDDPACNGGTGLFCGGVTVVGSESEDIASPDLPDANRYATIAAIDAYLTALHGSPESYKDTEAAIVDLVTDLSHLADHYRTEGYGDVQSTWAEILKRIANYRAEGEEEGA